MNFRNISAWSIRNPVVPIVFFIALTLAGIVSFMRMDVQNDPDIEIPVVVVSISQPGAAPSEIVAQVTQKVESAVRSIEGVRNINATAREGNTSVVAEFQVGDDINVAVSEIKNAIDQIRSDLPDGILEPQVFKVSTSGDPIAYFAVEASDMTLEQLSWFVDDAVTRELLKVDGLASVSRNGGVDREIRVILDPAKMQSFGVTAAQINGLLRQSNLDTTGGASQIANSRQSVRVLGNAETAYELSQRRLSLGNGTSVKLADIASVKDSVGEQRSMAIHKGKQVVTFGIARAKGASDVTVFDQAEAALKQIEANDPNVKFIQLYNSVVYTKAQYKSSMAAMVEGALLAIVVVFLFLRNWRATIISALAIPLSAIPTFWFLDSILGFTLNQMSLLALGLVAGVLVDDAIVEIENIVRHMRMGKSAYQASIDAADEIGLAVVATTFSIVAVFLPVSIMPGVAGQFFKNFGFTVVISVLMSLAVARMITPMIAAYFLEAEDKDADGHPDSAWMQHYMKILRWSLGHRRWMMAIGAAALGVTMLLMVVLPKQFFPDGNYDFSRVGIEMTPGTTLEQTKKTVTQVAEIFERQPDVKTALQSIGEGNGRIFITLDSDRKRTSQEFEEQINPLLQKIPDARVNFLANGPNGGGSGRDITVMLSGPDPDLIAKTAGTLVEEMKGLKQIVSPRIAAELQRPELLIMPRTDIAAQLGVSTVALSQVIRIATLGDLDQNSAKFSLSDRQIPIRVSLAEDERQSIDTIRNLPVPTSSGGTVPLSRVAEIKLSAGPTTIERRDQNYRIFVGADLAPGVAKGDADALIAKLPIMENLPNGVSDAPFGADAWQVEMMESFTVALISGTLLVFAVLVLLYRRFMSPLVNMGSLLLAPLGGLLALLIVGQAISLPVFIGILMLFGIVAKNSILLVDFALEEMDRGVPKFEAIMEAGHKRAQPIVMTTVAMTAGMVPTALSLSGDGAFRAPMGTVVIGGLIVSTLLTLLIVPAGFSLADGLEKRLGPWLRDTLLTYKPSEHGERQTAKVVTKDPSLQSAGMASSLSFKE